MGACRKLDIKFRGIGLGPLGICASLLLFASGRTSVMAQEPNGQLLDGLEIEYTYSDDVGTVVANFYDGKLAYRWIEGPFAGVEVRDRAYQSRRIGEDLYLVSWHDTENLNFVTLVFDFGRKREYGSALIGYTTDQEQVLFDEAVIDRMEGEP